jgi:hypothetical protein
VEGHDPHAARRAAQQQLDALAHLLRGLVGEGDRQQLGVARLSGLDEPGDAVGEDPGLARSGAGEDQQRPLAVRHRLALGWVEPFEEGLDAVVGGSLGHDLSA